MKALLTKQKTINKVILIPEYKNQAQSLSATKGVR